MKSLYVLKLLSPFNGGLSLGDSMIAHWIGLSTNKYGDWFHQMLSWMGDMWLSHLSLCTLICAIRLSHVNLLILHMVLKIYFGDNKNDIIHFITMVVTHGKWSYSVWNTVLTPRFYAWVKSWPICEGNIATHINLDYFNKSL